MLKFKANAEPRYTADFYYDITLGGYIKPENWLEPEDAARVRATIDLIEQFEEEAQNLDLIIDL